LPPPIAEIVEAFSGTDAPKQLVQRDEAQLKVRRPASKKASAPPKPDAQRDEQLYQEFLEWQKNRRDQR
jgi:ribulose kinase